jgi:hypothetical protein
MNNEESQKAPEQGAQPKNPNPLAGIHTYQNDIAQTIKEKDISVIDIALSEHASKQPLTKVDVKKNAFLLPIILLLIFGTVVAFLIIFLVKSRLDNTATPLETKSRIISTEQEILIPYTGLEPLNSLMLNASASSTPRTGSLLRYTFTDERSTSTAGKNIPIPVDDFITAFPTMPSHFARSLTADYLIGQHFQELSQDSYIILKTGSYEAALSGLLEWEKTMAGDIATLLNRFEIPTEEVVFEGAIIRNQNVRIATYPSDVPADTSGNVPRYPFIMYSLLNKDTIVITTSEETFVEILGRLATSQFVQ